MIDFQLPRLRNHCRQFLVLALLLPRLSGAQMPKSASPLPPELPTYVMEVGLARAAFSNVNFNDAMAAYRAFLENIGQRMGYKLRVEAAVFDDTAQFGEILSRKSQHLTVMDSWQYLDLDPHVDVHPTFVPLANGHLGRRILVVVRQDSGLKNMADLRGRSVVRVASLNNNVCRGWLKTILPGGLTQPESGFFASLESAAKPTAAVLPVYFGQKAACIVDEGGYELMKELNPQVGKTLTVIASSEVLVDIVVCLSEQNWPSPETRADTINAMGNLATDEAGRQILSLFRISGLMPYKNEQLDTVRQLHSSQHPLPVITTADSQRP